MKLQIIKKLALLAVSVVLILLILEGCFRLIRRSHGVGEPLAHQLWMEKYWHVNSMGFRDKEPHRAGKKTLLFVGDSFTAGDGICDPADRFSDLVGAAHPEYATYNLGVRGADPMVEAEALQAFIQTYNVTPSTIVWQYYGNDIDITAMQLGMQIEPLPFTPVQRWAADHLKGKSYLMDYIYWAAFHPSKDIYTDFLTKAYKNNEAISQHIQPLLGVAQICKARNIRLVVVIFPYLWDIPLARELYVPALTNMLQGIGVQVVDMSPAIEQLPVNDRIVNKNNPHPSIEVHRLTAEALTPIL